MISKPMLIKEILDYFSRENFRRINQSLSDLENYINKRSNFAFNFYVNGLVGASTFLHLFSNADSSQTEAPLIIPIDMTLKYITVGSNSNSTAVLGVYKNGNYLAPIASVELKNQKRAYLRDLNIQLLANDEVSVMVKSGTLNKPFVGLWFNS